MRFCYSILFDSDRNGVNAAHHGAGVTYCGFATGQIRRPTSRARRSRFGAADASVRHAIAVVAATATPTRLRRTRLPRSTIQHSPKPRAGRRSRRSPCIEPIDSVEIPVTPCPIVQPSAVIPPKPIRTAPTSRRFISAALAGISQRKVPSRHGGDERAGDQADHGADRKIRLQRGGQHEVEQRLAKRRDKGEGLDAARVEGVEARNAGRPPAARRRSGRSARR